MKPTDYPTKVIDEVITEVRLKRAILQRHGNDRLLASLMDHEREAGIGQAKQDGGGQQATRSESE